MMQLSRFLTHRSLAFCKTQHVSRPATILARLAGQRFFNSEEIEKPAVAQEVLVEKSKQSSETKELLKACGTIEDNDEEEEQEEMFVDADASLGLPREWGGPRRGGRLPEPTRFGDWERKGRCSDF